MRHTLHILRIFIRSLLSYFASHLYGPNDSCVVGRYTAPSSVFQMYSTDEVEVLTDISRRRLDANHNVLVSTGFKLVRSSIPGVHWAAATSLEPRRQACAMEGAKTAQTRHIRVLSKFFETNNTFNAYQRTLRRQLIDQVFASLVDPWSTARSIQARFHMCFLHRRSPKVCQQRPAHRTIGQVRNLTHRILAASRRRQQRS